MKRYFLATNDVESTSIRYNKQRAITAERVLQEGMPAMLEIYKKYNIKTTFFFTGEIAEQLPEVVRMVIPDGHEVACHGFSHENEFAFDKASYHEQLEYLTRSKSILEDIAGIKVRSFRAPALRVNEFTVKALITTGFDIDSSISSQRADNIFSHGALKKFNRFYAPRRPYYTDSRNLARKGKSPIYEIPISALFIPYIGTTMRIIPGLVKFLRQILNQETNLNGKPVNFLIHPNELIYESDDDFVARNATNPISRLFADRLRVMIKQKNLGKPAIGLLDEQIHYFHNLGYTFCTLSQYKDEFTTK